MGNLQQDLDAIAAKQGKSVPPGNFIEGGDRPWPSYDRETPSFEPGDRPAVSQQFADDLDDEGFEPPPSPLIPKAPIQAKLSGPPTENLENFRAPDMTILGNDDAAYIAAYQGRQVELSKVEAAAVRKVVLVAISRTIRLQLDEVTALLPKRKRRAVEPKKRGRPKKVAV